MTRGPERLRLDAALAEADEAVVRANGEAEWLSATYRLRDVSRALRVAANSGLGIGGQTGPAMFKAMRRSADHLDERITLFNEGREALGSAAETIRRVREQRDRLDTDPETAAIADPGEFRDDPEWDDEKRLREQSRHSAAAGAFADREALRERRAREIAEEFDRRYDEPIAVMKRIHGLPDPEPETASGGGGAGGGGRGSVPGPRGGSGPGAAGLLGGHPHPPYAGEPVGPGGDGSDPTGASVEDPSGSPDGSTATDQPSVLTSSPTAEAGGAGTAVGVGLGGGALLGGLARSGVLRGLTGGALVGGQQVRSTAGPQARPQGRPLGRPLGGLSRSAVSGTLGRSVAVGAPATSRPAARGGVGAASSAGRTPSSRGTAAAGSRGGAGTVAARAAGGAGGDRRRDRDGAPDHEHYEDDGSDWLDDEAAPRVLD
ncbi:hypothetical protein GCM10009812_36120 [Nocardioides marinus]|uniref:hypothetical protein n=1 Tax=Nocardioides marinus TaxID=374514 RepID=UPI0031E10D99